LDRSQNSLEIAKNVVIPESKHVISIRNQALISYRVCRRFIVLSAIDLNYEKLLAANEIADVTTYRFLPYKFMSIDLSVANAIPESGFRVCLIDAQPSRDSDHLSIWAAHCLAPHPEAPLRAASDLSPPRAAIRFTHLENRLKYRDLDDP
jgi:hypothetical protein